MVDPIITINDIRLAGYCAAGARSWFAEQGLDFRQFLRDGGWPASVFLAFPDDAVVAHVIERKKERERG